MNNTQKKNQNNEQQNEQEKPFSRISTIRESLTIKKETLEKVNYHKELLEGEITMLTLMLNAKEE